MEKRGKPVRLCCDVLAPEKVSLKWLMVAEQPPVKAIDELAAPEHGKRTLLLCLSRMERSRSGRSTVRRTKPWAGAGRVVDLKRLKQQQLVAGGDGPGAGSRRMRGSGKLERLQKADRDALRRWTILPLITKAARRCVWSEQNEGRD